MAPRVSVLRRMTLGMKKKEQLALDELKNVKEFFGDIIEEEEEPEEQPVAEEEPEKRSSNSKKDKYKSILHSTGMDDMSSSHTAGRQRSRSPRRNTTMVVPSPAPNSGLSLRNSTSLLRKSSQPSKATLSKSATAATTSTTTVPVQEATKQSHKKTERRITAMRKQKPQRNASIKRQAKRASDGSSNSKRHSKSRGSKRTSITISSNDFLCETNEVFKENYKFNDVMYEGEFCRIHSCTHLATNTSRVVKVVMEQDGDHSCGSSSGGDDTEEMSDFCCHMRDCPEFEIMRTIDSPFVPKVYRMYNQSNHHMIVMEKCHGNSLEKELAAHTQHGLLEEHHVKDIMWQMFSCLNYLHETALVVHGDIRPCNLMLDQEHDFGKIKLIDFDAAARLKDKDDKIRERRGGGSGRDIVYQAPEVHGSKPKYNSKADMWSCGIIMYQMLFGRLPFVESSRKIKKGIEEDQDKFPKSIKKTEKDIVRRMHRSKLRFPHGTNVSKEVKDLIASLLHPNSKRRPNAAKVLRDRWFRRDNARNNEAGSAALEIYGPASPDTTDPMAEMDRMSRLANLRKHNPNSRLKQAALSLMVADMLTKEEHTKIDQAFQKLDMHHDGKLRRHEVRAGFLLAFNTPLTEDELDDIFVRCDSNRNGSLDYSEFAVASMSEKELLTDDRLKRAFKRFDKHKRRCIGRAELQAVPAFSRCSKDQLDFIIAEVDLKGNGYIDFDNFVKCMRTGGIF